MDNLSRGLNFEKGASDESGFYRQQALKLVEWNQHAMGASNKKTNWFSTETVHE
jgi:hypothetical protein